MSNKDKAIMIAMDTFFAGYDGDAVEIYNRLHDETETRWYSIEYANVWSFFEDTEIMHVMSNVDDLIDSIIRNFGE
jgi:hypothetical protein